MTGADFLSPTVRPFLSLGPKVGEISRSLALVAVETPHGHLLNSDLSGARRGCVCVEVPADWTGGATRGEG